MESLRLHLERPLSVLPKRSWRTLFHLLLVCIRCDMIDSNSQCFNLTISYSFYLRNWTVEQRTQSTRYVGNIASWESLVGFWLAF